MINLVVQPCFDPLKWDDFKHEYGIALDGFVADGPKSGWPDA